MLSYRSVCILQLPVYVRKACSCYRGVFVLQSHVVIIGWRRSSGSWSNKRRSAIYARETYSVSIGPSHSVCSGP